MSLPKQTEHHQIYAPFVAAFETATKKRHIHKCGIYTSHHKPGHGLFIQTEITPHRSKGVHLGFIFSTSPQRGKKPVIRVKVTTYSSPDCESGAIGDAMMLVAELTTAWATLAEEAT